MTRPKLSAVATYASRIEKFEPKGVYWPILWIRAAAALGRAMGSVVGDKKPVKSYAVFETVTTKAREALQDWERKGFVHNLANAVKLLRVHASGLFDEQELAERLAGGVAPPSFHECSVISFGRLRVVDLSGMEKGGRHFGTHKSDSKPRKMLAALVAGAVQERRLTRERLVDMIWGDHVAGDTAANNFHVTLSGLRQVIGDSVDFDGTTYALNEQCVRVDAIEFLRLLAEATDHERAGRMFRAFDLLSSACALYTGEFLEGIFDEWSDGARDLLRAKARGAHLRLAEIAVQRGEFDMARQTVQRLLDHDSADEEAIYLHLSILNAEGDRVRALREYDRFAALLQNEYGVNPSRRLRDLRDLIAAD
jgi:DNA-binding SARP family transcriptional activator